MSNFTYSLLAVLTMGVVTAMIRFAPFVIFSNGRKTPAIIDYLGKVLPAAVMMMLVVYCLKGISFSSPSGFVPELIACAVTAALHVWRRKSILSIVGGTVVYMLLVQLVF